LGSVQRALIAGLDRLPFQRKRKALSLFMLGRIFLR
jgi:hypothetical protein